MAILKKDVKLKSGVALKKEAPTRSMQERILELLRSNMTRKV